MKGTAKLFVVGTALLILAVVCIVTIATMKISKEFLGIPVAMAIAGFAMQILAFGYEKTRLDSHEEAFDETSERIRKMIGSSGDNE